MRPSFGLLCIAACGVAASALLWCDRGPARQPAVASARAQARPAEPEQPAFAAPAPRPSLTPATEVQRPVPPPAPALAADTPPPGDDGEDDGDGEDEDIAVTHALVRGSLARDIPRKLPELRLLPADLDRLTDTVLRVREHQIRLRGLAHTRENAVEIARLEIELAHDLMVFEEVTGMSATEFTGALSDEGITTEEQARAEKPVYWTLPE